MGSVSATCSAQRQDGHKHRRPEQTRSLIQTLLYQVVVAGEVRSCLKSAVTQPSPSFSLNSRRTVTAESPHVAQAWAPVGSLLRRPAAANPRARVAPARAPQVRLATDAIAPESPSWHNRRVATGVLTTLLLGAGPVQHTRKYDPLELVWDASPECPGPLEVKAAITSFLSTPHDAGEAVQVSWARRCSRPDLRTRALHSQRWHRRASRAVGDLLQRAR